MQGQLVCVACELKRTGQLAGEQHGAGREHERSLVTEDGVYHFLKSARAEKLSRSEEYAGRWIDVAGNLYEDAGVLHVTQHRPVRGQKQSLATAWRTEPLTVTGRAT